MYREIMLFYKSILWGNYSMNCILDSPIKWSMFIMVSSVLLHHTVCNVLMEWLSVAEIFNHCWPDLACFPIRFGVEGYIWKDTQVLNVRRMQHLCCDCQMVGHFPVGSIFWMHNGFKAGLQCPDPAVCFLRMYSKTSSSLCGQMYWAAWLKH